MLPHAAEPQKMMNTMPLDSGWHVLQDVFDDGELLGLHGAGWGNREREARRGLTDEWEPIEKLAHLQLLFTETPYWGRELRYFNESPWWYRNEFAVPPEFEGKGATLRFSGVDYYCKAWLNGEYLGEHEGYFAPFSFEIGSLLKREDFNLLAVKVWSPWDRALTGRPRENATVVRDMIKGAYEHADTFIQRDVNPVGIWSGVELRFHHELRLEEDVHIAAVPSADFSGACVKIHFCAIADTACSAVLRVRIVEKDTGKTVAEESCALALSEERCEKAVETTINGPRLWNTWDRGGQNLYVAELQLFTPNTAGTPYRATYTFGVRSLELVRNADEITYYLNGKKLYLRGTAYFPDNYVSAMCGERYLRDLSAIKAAGFNAVRVHVHVEKPEFYSLCDAMGIAVMQDSDLNWTHPATPEWMGRAVKVFGDMVRLLRNHPSVITWICMNEPTGYAGGEMMRKMPGPQLYAEAGRLDPYRPAIMGSGGADDPDSGDTHNYLGSLEGARTHYTDIHSQRHERLNTEFGFDAPPSADILRRRPALFGRLRGIHGDIPALQYYQYRYVKYFIEHYRIAKYAPCSGYFQFMFIDLSPQSFYGLYDWYGLPKAAAAVMAESNQPVGVFMEHCDVPEALWIVNDGDRGLGLCGLAYTVTDDGHGLVAEGEISIEVGPDAALRACDFAFDVKKGLKYRVALTLTDPSGGIAAKNIYDDPFNHPPHPAGHPDRVSCNYGMRLYHA